MEINNQNELAPSYDDVLNEEYEAQQRENEFARFPIPGLKRKMKSFARKSVTVPWLYDYRGYIIVGRSENGTVQLLQFLEGLQNSRMMTATIGSDADVDISGTPVFAMGSLPDARKMNIVSVDDYIAITDDRLLQTMELENQGSQLAIQMDDDGELHYNMVRIYSITL